MMWWKKLPYFFRGINTSDIDCATASAQWEFATWLCTRYLKHNPTSAPVVLTRARCHEMLKRKPSQWADVELAYAIDDTFIPGIYSYAMVLLERNEVDKALPLFAVIKDHPAAREGVDAALSEICMRQANADLGSEYQLRSWMGNFDQIRYANACLFRLTYSNATELNCAQEHKFWADTLLPLKEKPGKSNLLATEKITNFGQFKSGGQGRRKIGYWGGDFKEHSVRYFSRPLIESHDHEAWEIYIYDDNFWSGEPDQQTRAFWAAADNYYDISQWDDDSVVELIRSHQLDVLVELQGHTSANRLHLWQQRLARLQVTGLAYPPTTGLSSIDFKMVDVHMLGEDSHRYYTERQMVMPESFWCFDPKEEAYYATVPPYRTTGYLTYASMGNGAKITEPLMRAWARILAKAPNVRLLVVSHTFGDECTISYFKRHMSNSGVDMSRLTCRLSFPRDELWKRYSDVDLVLDTFPFNGGTTSCWATYAGVPVLTMAGKSLSSCMGKSIMTNLGFPEFVTYELSEYVDKAVEIAQHPEVLDRFRSCARARFLDSSLGNGKKFTAEFEALCERLLSMPAQVPAPDVPPLDLPEMLRRARLVWYYGNVSACERIVAVCRKHYGDAIEIDELVVESLLGQRKFDELRSLGARLDKSQCLQHLHALCEISTDRTPSAIRIVQRMLSSHNSIPGSEQNLQNRLWHSWLMVRLDESPAPPKLVRWQGQKSICQVVFWIVGDGVAGFEEQKTRIEKLLVGQPFNLVFENVPHYERADCLNKLLQKYAVSGAMAVLIHECVELIDANILFELAEALLDADIVGVAGALRWVQKDWTLDLPSQKAWGVMRPSKLNDEHYELHFSGVDAHRVVKDAAVLDGKLLSFKPEGFAGMVFDDDMGDPGLWIEEDWCHRAHLGGRRLVIHRGLGVITRETGSQHSLHTAAGQKGLLERINPDPLRLSIMNYDVCTVQVDSAEMGLKVTSNYLQSS